MPDKITVTRALTERKNLEDRINAAILDLQAVTLVQGKKDVTDRGVKLVDFEKTAQAKWQKVTDLIDRRAKLKAAITASNATVLVKINNEEMTVSTAIERKSGMFHTKTLITFLRRQFVEVSTTLERQNAQVQLKLEAQLQQLFGSDRAKVSDEAEVTSKSYMERHEYKLVDPLKAQSTYDQLETNVANFLQEVDVCLSEVNSQTYIEV